MNKTAILIPARYASTRFPGKPLVELDGVPMIKRVYDACVASKIPTYVLTDDMRIFELFNSTNCWIDETPYENGTERCAGAIKNDFFKDYNQFINVQGDMPDVTQLMIERCVEWLQYYPVSTVFATMPEEIQNEPNSVKMVRAGDQALWFGRGMTGYGEWHLGVYGYRRNALKCISNIRELRKKKTVEKLEQLTMVKKWLANRL